MEQKDACELPMCLRARYVFAARKADMGELRAEAAELRKKFKRERQALRRRRKPA